MAELQPGFDAEAVWEWMLRTRYYCIHGRFGK